MKFKDITGLFKIEQKIQFNNNNNINKKEREKHKRATRVINSHSIGGGSRN
jgi:hypothetical protein